MSNGINLLQVQALIRSIMLTDESEPNPRLAQAVDHAKTLAWKRAGKQVCACCGKRGERFVADHNHVTLQQRAQVCHACNTIIGYAEWAEQNPEKLRMVLDYLKTHDPFHRMLFPNDI
jgi:hypothetical protein